MHYKKWNKTKINEQLKELRALFDKEPSSELVYAIGSLEDLLKNDPKFYVPERSFTQQVAKEQNLVEEFSQFMQAISLFTAHNDISSVKLDDYCELNIPNKQLLSFVHDFFNSIDRDFARYFNRIYKERKNNLRLTKSPIQGHNRQYSYYIKPCNYAYINIPLSETVVDFANIVHEYAHTISDQMFYRMKYDKYPFVELLPLLMQQIAYDKIDESFEGMEDEVAKADIMNLQDILLFSNQIKMQNDYISSRVPFTERRQFISNFAQFSNNTRTKAEKIINCPLEEKLMYVIPYITMIELYDMYQEDPERALFLIKEIIMAKEQENYYKYLESLGINLNEHSKDFIKTRKNKNITEYM